MREARKIEHIENCLKSEYVGDNLFSEVLLEHNALPELSIDEIDTSIEFLGKKLDFPLIINAMTGGPEMSLEINRDLAKLAKEFGLAMAVGSEKIAVDDENTKASFEVIRQELGDENIVIGNIGANSSLDEIKKARDIIRADLMELHLNPAQELTMEFGDRDFRGVLDNISQAVEELDFPIMVKEVGFGISPSVAQRLYDKGVRIIDIAGAGGTNFIEIENIRRQDIDFSDIYDWGLPTALLLEEYQKLPCDLIVVASGGLKTAMDMVKAFAMGADLGALAGELLRFLMHGGYEYAREYLEAFIYKTKLLMLLCGARNISELKCVPYRITGKLKELTSCK